MGDAMMGSDRGDNEAMRPLLGVNALDFRMAPSLSIVTSRTLKRWPAQLPSYTQGGEMTFTLSTGASYVDAKNSFIEFELVVTNNNAATVSNINFTGTDNTLGGDNAKFDSAGGALSLFRNMQLTHSSGYDIDRMEGGFGQWAAVNGRLGRTTNYKQGPATLFQNEPVFGGLTGEIPSIDTLKSSPSFKVVIPLSHISGVFDVDTLLPSFLVAGARLQLKLESETARVFDYTIGGASDAGSGLSYTIGNAYIYCETITLTDKAVQALATQSASVGLEIPFTRCHHQQQVIAASTGANIQVSRALSRANAVIIVQNDATLNTTNFGSPGRTLRRKLTEPVDYEEGVSFQVKLGAEYLPSQPVTGAMEAYHAAQAAYGGFHGLVGNGVGVQLFKTQVGCMVQTLEKSSVLAQSGSPIAANRDMNVQITGLDNAKTRVFHTFVPHVALCSVFLDSVLVRS
jgi:hypothetical protein